MPIVNEENISAMETEETKVPVTEVEAAPTEETAGNPFTALRESCDTQTPSTNDIESENATDFEAFKKLPYIDLYAKKNEAAANIEELRGMKATMDMIADMSADEYAAMVGQMNELDYNNAKKDIKTFYEQYPEMSVEAERIYTLLTKMLMMFDKDVVASTSFISKSMVESAEIRKESMLKNENPSMNQKLILKRLEETKAAYADRTNMDILFHKLRYPNNTLEIYEEFTKSPEESMKYINRIFMPVFNDQNMAKFRASLIKGCINENMSDATQSTVEVLAFFMTFWLAKIYEREYQSGKCARAKVLVMNVYDMDESSDIYDEIGGKEYMKDLVFTMYMILAVSTNGQTPKKQLTKKINAIIDDLLKVLYTKRDKLFEENPGREIELGTDLESITDGEITLEDLPELKKVEDVKSEANEPVEVEAEVVEEETADVDDPEIVGGEEQVPDYSPDDNIPEAPKTPKIAN